ncbi:hypothetical protein AGR1C_pAt30081 [Agrobacterium fabacearum TT111]|nr:hypothetical protein AGR1C_pAt30081 [Agrobacterium fabacearum TT111]
MKPLTVQTSMSFQQERSASRCCFRVTQTIGTKITDATAHLQNVRPNGGRFAANARPIRRFMAQKRGGSGSKIRGLCQSAEVSEFIAVRIDRPSRCDPKTNPAIVTPLVVDLQNAESR